VAAPSGLQRAGGAVRSGINGLNIVDHVSGDMRNKFFREVHGLSLSRWENKAHFLGVFMSASSLVKVYQPASCGGVVKEAVQVRLSNN